MKIQIFLMVALTLLANGKPVPENKRDKRDQDEKSVVNTGNIYGPPSASESMRWQLDLLLSDEFNGDELDPEKNTVKIDWVRAWKPVKVKYHLLWKSTAGL